MVIISKESCPYFSEEMRVKWYQERGIEDRGRKVVRKKRMEDSVPDKPEPVFLPKEETQPVIEEEVKAPPLQEGMTKEQRYRARNKEKIAQRARERRAKK
jgi:hypothetical protein